MSECFRRQGHTPQSSRPYTHPSSRCNGMHDGPQGGDRHLEVDVHFLRTVFGQPAHVGIILNSRFSRLTPSRDTAEHVSLLNRGSYGGFARNLIVAAEHLILSRREQRCPPRLSQDRVVAPPLRRLACSRSPARKSRAGALATKHREEIESIHLERFIGY